MNPLSSELPFHVHNWLIISLKDFCIVIRKRPTFWPSSYNISFKIEKSAVISSVVIKKEVHALPPT